MVLPALENFFFDFFKSSLLKSKKHFLYPEYQKTIFSAFICLENTNDKNVDFFNKKHGLTLLEKSDFVDFFEAFLFWS